MIQHSIEIRPEMSGHWFVVNKGKLWLTTEFEVPVGPWQQLPFADVELCCKIGEWQGQSCYLVVWQQQVLVESDWHTARTLLNHPDPSAFELGARACQLALFMQTHRYCGQCGCAMHQVSWELAMLCHKCGHRVYPRISPCVLIAIVKGPKILLARSDRHKVGFFSILAGFVESGETLEQAAKREVMEEVGISIKNLRYVGSQPWPFPHSLMAGFIADYAGGEICCQENEIAEAAWFDLAALPEVPPRQTLSGQIIEQLKIARSTLENA